VIQTVLQAYTQSDPTDIKLLTVEDDPITSKTVRSIVKPLGLQFWNAKNALWGWKKLAQYQPDVMLLSTDLPNHSGFDLCQVIRHEPRWRDLPIIFMVSNSDPETVNRICTVGATACIGKPITEADLMSRILRCAKGTHRARVNTLAT
jgi:CheY-like chemotaxis protein